MFHQKMCKIFSENQKKSMESVAQPLLEGCSQTCEFLGGVIDHL